MANDPTPVTRSESFLYGEDLTPVTRMEWFLKKAGSGGGSDLPEYAAADAGEVLTVSAGGSSLEWAAVPKELPEIPLNYQRALLKVNDAGTAAAWVRQPVVYNRMIKLDLTESSGSWDVYPTSDISGTLPIEDAFNALGYSEPVYFLIRMTDSQNVEKTLYSDIAEISGTDPYSGGHVLITALAPAASTQIPVYIFDWTYNDMDGIDEISVTKKSITLGN